MQFAWFPSLERLSLVCFIWRLLTLCAAILCLSCQLFEKICACGLAKNHMKIFKNGVWSHKSHEWWCSGSKQICWMLPYSLSFIRKSLWMRQLLTLCLWPLYKLNMAMSLGETLCLCCGFQKSHQRIKDTAVQKLSLLLYNVQQSFASTMGSEVANILLFQI